MAKIAYNYLRDLRGTFGGIVLEECQDTHPYHPTTLPTQYLGAPRTFCLELSSGTYLEPFHSFYSGIVPLPGELPFLIACLLSLGHLRPPGNLFPVLSLENTPSSLRLEFSSILVVPNELSGSKLEPSEFAMELRDFVPQLLAPASPSHPLFSSCLISDLRAEWVYHDNTC
jgi:hypothetical protein